MSRDFDIVIFGASGFVGKYAIQNLHESAKRDGLRWAVAGRSEDKVRQALQFASELCGQVLADVPVVVANVSDYDSLLSMARRTRVVVNCVGPYTLYGEPVVKACVESGTDHVDVTGEVNWLEDMHMKYDAKARETKALIVGACAFESIPSEMAVNWMRRQFESRGWTLNAVQNYANVIGGGSGVSINHGTWDSSIMFVGKFWQMRKAQRTLYGQFFPKITPPFAYTIPKNLLLHPRLAANYQVPIYETDCMVSKRTNAMNFNARSERPVYVAKYATVSSFWYILAFSGFLVTFGPLFLFNAGRKLLMRYPHIFSFGFFTKQGPTLQQVAETRFEVIVRASGWKEQLNADQKPTRAPDTQLYGIIRGPEPTYPTTSQCAIQSAVTLVRERLKIGMEGGVATPGVAFRNTSLMERLSNAPINQITFEPLD